MSVGELASTTSPEAAASVGVTQAVLHAAGVTPEMPEGGRSVPATDILPVTDHGAPPQETPTKLPPNHPLLYLQEQEAAAAGPNYSERRFYQYF